MNGNQLLFAAFALFVIVICLWSIVAVVRSPVLKLKPLWIVGCLFGFVGLGIEWTAPDKLFMLFGITIPVVTVFKVFATGQVIVKTGFPLVSVLALVKVFDDNLPNDSQF